MRQPIETRRGPAMANALGGIRSKAARQRTRALTGVRTDPPSIREVCLVGLGGGGAGGDARPLPEGGWISEERVMWSGRTYRVEATQVGPAKGGGSRGYLYLSALGEG